MKVWQCTVCKYIHKGDTPPEKCPVCGVDKSRFIEITETYLPEKKPGGNGLKKESKKPPATKPVPKAPPMPKETGFEKIQSFLIRHHIHPVSVHTPNGVLPLAVILWLIAWMIGSDLFAAAAFINMVFVICAFPVVIYTGVLEWKKKYNSALTPIFKLKILAATITVVSCLISSLWYLVDCQVLSSPKAWVFICINIIMLTAAGIAGFIGGKLVFKD